MIQLFTIGHSTHSKEDFLQIIKSFDIELLVDVRSYPGSRYVPQFNKEEMQKWITDAGVEYLHLPLLGGRRRNLEGVDPNLINGWKNISFRNYAAYTFTHEFEKGIKELTSLARVKRVCIMSAESLPWRCHRLIISNTLHFMGVKVFHIIKKDNFIIHEVNKFGAKVDFFEGKVCYPGKDKKVNKIL